MICSYCGRTGHTAARCKTRPVVRFLLALPGLGCAVGLVVALALAACSQPPPPEIRYVTVSEKAPPPVIASECNADGPADPKLASGQALDVARFIEAMKTQRRVLVKLRRVCKASLAAHSRVGMFAGAANNTR